MEERWITVNGAHVLLKDGDPQALWLAPRIKHLDSKGQEKPQPKRSVSSERTVAQPKRRSEPRVRWLGERKKRK